jgi:membrane protease YdiL (CAAX protease family)
MNQLPPPTTAPAGWYPDPRGHGHRYFDGRAWVPAGPYFEEREEHPDLPLGAAIGALLVLVVSLLAAKLLVDALIDLDWPVLAYIVLLALIGYGPSLVWGWYVRHRWGAGKLAALGWRFRWSDLGWGPLTWLAAVCTQLVMAAIILVLDIPLSSNVESVSDLEADRAYLIATAITAVVAAPIIEEVVFRGLVLRGFLSRMGPALAIALQGVLFGVAHVDPVRGIGNIGLAIVLSGVGVAFGAAAFLTRRLGPTVIAHAIFNGVVLTIVLSGVFDDVETDFGSPQVPPAAAASVLVEDPVVDQPHVAEPGGGDHHGRRVDALDGFERAGVDQLEVLESGARLGRDQRGGGGAEPRGVPLAVVELLPGGGERS